MDVKIASVVASGKFDSEFIQVLERIRRLNAHQRQRVCESECFFKRHGAAGPMAGNQPCSKLNSPRSARASGCKPD
jgi:hypothetical protein